MNYVTYLCVFDFEGRSHFTSFYIDLSRKVEIYKQAKTMKFLN